MNKYRVTWNLSNATVSIDIAAITILAAIKQVCIVEMLNETVIVEAKQLSN